MHDVPVAPPEVRVRAARDLHRARLVARLRRHDRRAREAARARLVRLVRS